MKILKLSLVATLAMGSLYASDTMTSIEEALKDVKIDGFARYRFNDYDSKSKENYKSYNDLDLNFGVHVPIADNLMISSYIQATGRYYNNDGEGYDNNNEVTIPDFFVTYKYNGLTAKAGKMVLGLPITDNGYKGTRGVGLNASYELNNITFTGAFFNNIDRFGSGSELGFGDDARNDVSTLAVLANFDMVDAQVWGMKVAGLIDSMVFAEAGVNFAGFRIAAQAIHTQMDSQSDYMMARGTGAEDTGTFYALKAGWANDRFRVNGVYASNDDDMAVHGIDHDVDTQVFHAGYRLADDFGTQAGQEGMDTMGIDAGVTFGKVSFDAGYAVATDMKNNVDIDKKDDAKEYWAKLGYKYNKKISTYIAYSDISSDNDYIDQKFVRFEAKYNF